MVHEPDSRRESGVSTRTTTSWEELAAWWDERQGEEGDLYHRAIIDPTLLRVLGPVQRLDVLDLACGNGYLSRKLARFGANVTGVDASAPIIELARSREERVPLGVRYHVADASQMDMLEDGSFDVTICNMGLTDMPDAEGALTETSRVLRSGGRLVASLPHPCFDVAEDSGWSVERMGPNETVFRKVSHYRETSRRRWHYWRVEEGGVLYTLTYHRPLSWWFRALRSAGFAVSSFEEPEPTEEFLAENPRGWWIGQVPIHAIIEAFKVGGLTPP